MAVQVAGALLPYAATAAMALANKKHAPIIIVGGIIITGLLIKKGVVDPALVFFNLKDSPEEKDAEKKADELEKNAFDPKYYAELQKTTSFIIPNAARAEQYITQIYKAKGIAIFPDDEESVIAVFRLMPSKAYVSYISAAFAKKYKSDLLTFLKSFMSNNWNPTEPNYFYDLMNIVSRLPNYTK